jgi:hypothetical protein
MQWRLGERATFEWNVSVAPKGSKLCLLESRIMGNIKKSDRRGVGAGWEGEGHENGFWLQEEVHVELRMVCTLLRRGNGA